MRSIILILSLHLSHAGHSQSILGFYTEYNDSFHSWNVEYVLQDTVELLDDDIMTGEITLSWSNNQNWSDWDHRYNESRGYFEVRGNQYTPYFQYAVDGSTLESRPVWPRDLSNWSFNYEDHTYQLKALYPNIIEEWLILKDDEVVANVLTEQELDLRVWQVVYHNEISLPLKVQMMMVNMIIYLTSPKF